MRNSKRGVRLLLFVFIVFHLAAFSGLLVYHYNTRIFSKIEINSAKQFAVYIITPLNHRSFLGLTGSGTVSLEKRPVKQIEIVGNTRTILINSMESANEFLRNNPELNLTMGAKDEGVFSTLFWVLNNGYHSQLLFLFYLLCLIVALYIKRKVVTVGLQHAKRRIFRWVIRGNRISFSNGLDQISFKPYQKILAVALCLMICFQLFHNLGNNPLSHTSLESRRALVAMEMKISGNYTSPTICGAPYLNKFPAGHWAFVPFISKEGNIEGRLRAVASGFILLSSLIIFMFIRKIKKSSSLAFLVAISFVCSMLVLNFKVIKLDQFFTAVCLLLFFSNYVLFKSKRILWMFLVSYFIMFIGFLTKGLLMVYFNGLSLLILLYVHQQLRYLISWKHLCGMLLFVVLTAGYFLLYARFFDPGAYLFNQIVQMDHFTSFSLLYRIRHFLGFWGNNMIQYAPVLVLLPLLFTKKYFLVMIKDKFLAYLFLLSFFGAGVFWFSPEYLSYYILMFVPLMMCLLINLIFTINIKDNKTKAGAMLAIVVLLSLALSFPGIDYPGKIVFMAPILVLAVLPVLLPRKFRLNALLFSWMFLLIVSGLMETLKVQGKDTSVEINSKTSAQRVIAETGNSPLRLYSGETQIQDAVVFYLEYYGQEIIRIAHDEDNRHSGYFLANKDQIRPGYVVLDSIPQYVYINESIDRRVTSVCYPVYLIKK